MEFGNTTYGGENKPAIARYRYFRVEADVILPVGIPFLTGVGFYGFGGGAFYNMTWKQVLNKTGDGYKFSFTPEKSKLGFKVKAIIGTLPKFDSFNADVELLAEFSTSNGMTQIGFNGSFWVAADLASREKAYVKGGVAMNYNFPDKIFDLQAKVMVNIYPDMQDPIIVTPTAVGLHLNINGRTNKWYFISGTPTATNTVNIFGISLYSYLMFGNDIPVPNGFTQRFINGYSSAIGSAPDFSSGSGGVDRGCCCAIIP